MQQPRVVDAYELSPTQEGMLFHALQGEATGVDLEQIVCSIRGAFDADVFVEAFQEISRRHPILRTRFSFDEDGRPMQEVAETVCIPAARADLSQVPAAERATQLDEILRLDRARGIDIRTAPAMRLLLVDWSPDEHGFIWTFHHALLDGRSFPIVLREVLGHYEAAVSGRTFDPPLPRPYRDYIEWLRSLDPEPAEAFWREYLRGFTAPTPLVIDRRTPDQGLTTGIQGVIERRLTRETSERLRQFADAQGVTVNTLFQSAWAILLHRYSGEADIVFGATRACRRTALSGAEDMVGLFINTLPFRVRLSPDGHLTDLLREVRALQIKLRDHEHTPLAKVHGWSDVPRGQALFDTILVYEDRTLDASLRSAGFKGIDVNFSYHGQTNYPLTAIAYGDDEMVIRIENDRRHIDDAPAARMLGHLATLITAMPDRADQPLHALPILDADERKALSAAGEEVSFGASGCLHERFEVWAKRAPERVAVVCDGESLSYGVLDRRANALAFKLQALGVGRGVLVGLRCERSLSIVVGILGILKAGGAYVPLDPAYPKDRVDFMLADSEVKVVVTQAAFVKELQATQATLVEIDQHRDEAAQAPESGVRPHDLAYVIYTSGSTGRPKGVLISHFNVTRLFDATARWFEFGDTDVWTLFHSYAFDFSVWEMWGALSFGGRLVVVPYWVSRSPQAFRQLVIDENVTVLNQTPSAFRQFIDADQALAPAAMALRYVVFGGEALQLQSLRPWMERYGDVRPQLVNMYGITETTVHVTYRPVALNDLDAGAGSVIGVPIPDLRLLVLDDYQQPVPIGVPGELYVGGAGVSRGYLKRPELTAQRFVPDPFAGTPHARLYRTGDLARRLDNGDLEYLGRIDDQVKIRGFRIELGEIEAVLRQHPAIAQAIVIAREDAGSDKRLVAYIVAHDPAPGVDELKNLLRAHLPEYMVPAHVVSLAELPLTPNGKVDRKALPAPSYARLETVRPYIAPRTPTEQTVAAIWAAVLGAPRVSIEDNFFELGGDSILTIQVIARCRQAGLHFTPRDLAKRPTVAQLAKVIEPVGPLTAVQPNTAGGTVAATPIQRWFFERNFVDPNYWNQAFLFHVPATVDVETLQLALRAVVAHHDTLRMRVLRQGADVTLHHDAGGPLPSIGRIDLSEVAPQDRPRAIEQVATAAQAALDLQRGALVAAVYFKCGPDPGRLLLAIHHLAVDGVSWRLVIEDLEAAYRALAQGSPVRLPPPTTAFGRWSEALAAYAATADVSGALPRWLEIESHDGTLPTDVFDLGPNLEGQVGETVVALGRDETQALLQRVPAAYSTRINDILLTALALTLRAWTGREAHRIDLEGHGREEWVGDVDLSRTVGWFTTLYPVVLDLAGAQGSGPAVKTIKECLRQVPHVGLSYGLLRYGMDGREGAPGLAERRPADLLFNYLGQFDQVVAGSEMFGFAPEPTGAWHGPANERTHRFEVVAQVREGRFEARWLHGTGRDRSEWVEQLAGNFIDALRHLIEHCTEPGVKGYTPSDFPLAGLEQGALDLLAAQHPDLEDVYPLSPMQRLFLSMESGSTGLGFEQWVFRLRGPLNPQALRQAWEDVLARHAMLRTAFVSDGFRQPLQVVKRQVPAPWAHEDWAGRDGADLPAALDSWLRMDRERGFDVSEAPLHRVMLIRLAPDDHRLIWSTHHLYVDGWSWPLIFGDVAKAYEARVRGARPHLLTPCSYRSFVSWLHDGAPDSRGFWEERLGGFTSPTPLPFEAATTTHGGGEATKEQSTRLGAAATTGLQALARARRVTLSTIVQAAWAALLAHLSDRKEVVFGAAFSGRPAELEGIETLVGPCVNNLPVSVRIDPDQQVSDWLSELHARNTEIAEHQYASVADIQEWAGVPWRHRLFDSLLVFQNYVVDRAVLRLGDVAVEPVAAPERTNYPLTLTATPGPDLELKLVGQANRFGRATLSMMLDGLTTVLARIASAPDASLREILASLPASTQGRAAAVPAGPPQIRVATYAAPVGQMERAVADVWQDLFQIGQIGMDDNFFDLGGHSILLLQAHARLRAKLDPGLPVVALLQYPTIRTLARHLSGAGPSGTDHGAIQDRVDKQRQALARRRTLHERR